MEEKMKIFKFVFLVFGLLLAHTVLAEGLVGPAGSDNETRNSLQVTCLRQAAGNSRSDIGLSDELASALLKGKDTKGFLWRGSLSGPRLIAEREGGVLAPSQSVFNAFRSHEITDRFVLCLLTYGYRWENNTKDGIAEITDLAEQGNPIAQSTLGLMYYHGHGVKLDHTLAIAWIRRAAEHGYANAQYNLGIAYGKGEGVPTDETEAIRWMKRAAEQGHTKAKVVVEEYEANKSTLTKEVPKEPGLDKLRAAAARGNADALFQLATKYEDGDGVQRNVEAALRYYHQSADRGNVHAQTYIGVIYDKGRGVQQDDSEALRWYKKAAQNGHPQAQFNLGVFLIDGRGTSADESEGWKWIRKAAEGGHPDAKFAVEKYGK